jgi:DNA-binding response OmpR family regulator
MRILVVEDERGIADFVTQGLHEAGYAVDLARDGDDGLDMALSTDFDVILLDIMLPKMDGIAVVKSLRQNKKKTPVLLLTARDSVNDRVKGLDAGADDYLVKPFAFPELLARVRALLRRPAVAVETTVEIGNLVLDTVRCEVLKNGESVDLSAREFGIMEYLMRNEGRTLTREQIEEHVWNFDSALGSNIVDVYIGYLRKKIDSPGKESVIRTVRGIGYRLETGNCK